MGCKKIAVLVCFLLGMFISYQGLAQNSSLPQNLSLVRVDNLSDDQIRAFMREVESTGLPDSQIEQVAAARGMSKTEVQKLRIRINRIKGSGGNKQTDGQESDGSKSNTGMDSTRNIGAETQAERALRELRMKIFGFNLFNNTNLTFEPNLRLATPSNYVIGPDDEIAIDINGDNEATYKLKVSPEGTIRIQYAGIVQVSGLTIEQARQRIRTRLASTYPGLNSGRTTVTIGIGNIRSIKITIIGEVMKPGSYTLPSVATVFNALYASGGPNENGSLREIEVVRDNGVIAKIDVYDFLLKGFQTNNIRLQDQDVIRVPTYRLRVEFSGEVKRPAIFEVLPNENLSDVLGFAGGFNDLAYSTRIKVLQNTNRERRIADIPESIFNTYKPKRGDVYVVEKILERFENRVQIEGAVFRPGEFELVKGLSLSALIRKAEGVKEDAFLSRGYITRLRADNSTELLSFDLSKVLAGTGEDILLQREDIVTISSIFDLREEYKVSIEGEVRQSGEFEYAENMNLEDLVIKAGGFKEGASAKRIEISRRVKNSNILSTSAVTAEVFQVDVSKDLKFSVNKFILEPFDIVSVRNATGYEVQRQVWIDGEVLYPGKYTLSRKDERISDMINRAGGYTPLAYPIGASLKRVVQASKVSTNTAEDKIIVEATAQTSDLSESRQQDNRNQSDSSFTGVQRKIAPVIPYGYVGIDLVRIMQAPGSNFDLILEEGDSIRVPKQLQTIKVNGEVRNPVTIIFDKDKRFKDYIYEAGGFTERSLRRKAYLVYANGSVKSTRRTLFINHFPKVEPGAELYIPLAEPRRKVSIAELVGVGTGLVSLALIVLNLLRL